MTETLQQKIDDLKVRFEYPEDGEELDKALREFREKIEALDTKCDCPLCNEKTRTIKNVLALIGENKEC